jgi:phenylacetate-coenzyme A ligase PaaK-like adenylate-forming protein
MPLIRYEITDPVTAINGPCACGSAHRRIADIQGVATMSLSTPTV